MDASSRIAAGSDTLYGPPCGRTVTVPSADALMARERQVPEACDALALSGGLACSALAASYRARQHGVSCWSARQAAAGGAGRTMRIGSVMARASSATI